MDRPWSPIKLVSLQAEIISSCIVAFASPLFSIISRVSHFLHGQPHQDPVEDFQPVSSSAAADVPSTVARGGSLRLGRIAMGLLAAACVLMVLVMVMIVAAMLGVAAVRSWAEEPLHVKENLQFDYADTHPSAVFNFGNKGGLPVGHTLYVSLVLIMPESDYNRDIGIFQLSAELIFVGGELITKSSHPCMLQFRSWPIRLVRTFLMGVPLLLGITSETQKITVPILKHKEVSYPRTDKIRITLIPRAGTSSLPQFYDGELIVRSRLPWTKEMVYRWKWTFYVWTTLHIFIMLVTILVFFLKPLIFPVMTTPVEKYEQALVAEVVPQKPLARTREPEGVGSSASSITVADGESSLNFEEGSGDSESVCLKGVN